MVMAKIDRAPFPKPTPKPQLPTEPGKTIGPGGCIPGPVFPKQSEFDKKDGNKDGKLNADEFNEGRGLVEKALDPDKFDRYDADNDGYVTKGEDMSGRLGDAFRKSKLDLGNLADKLKPGIDLDPGIKKFPIDKPSVPGV